MIVSSPFMLPARAAFLALALALAGCSSTASSSSNAPDGNLKQEPKKETTAETAQKVEQIETAALKRHDRSHVTRTGEVYLMRGLLNVFSRGMDTLAARMRSRGFDAVSYNHSEWQDYADDIVARAKRKEVSYPIIIMGHSLGGNAAPQMANYLAARGVNTQLIVAFDPTEPQVVGKGIGDVVNYYLPNGRNTFAKASGFTGSLQNITVTHLPDIKHVNVEKNNKLQNQSIEHAMRITKQTSGKRTTRNRQKLLVRG